MCECDRDRLRWVGRRVALLGGMLFVFPSPGTIIPESKLRRVHGWLEISYSFSNQRFLLLQCCCSEAMLGSPDSHTLNTKNFETVKESKIASNKSSCHVILSSLLYVALYGWSLWSGADTQSYLEPYRVYFKSCL